MSKYETVIVCIRHGESESNAHLHEMMKSPNFDASNVILKNNSDPELTEIGFKQALETAKHLTDPIERTKSFEVFCSPLKRAQQTLLAFPHFKDHIILPNMIEYRRGVNIESFLKQTYELFQFLNEKGKSAMKPQTIFLVGHSISFSTLLTIFTMYRNGISEEEHVNKVRERFSNPDYLETIYQLPNCSISVLSGVVDDQKKVDWKVLGIGKCEHLSRFGLATGKLSDF